MLRSRKHLAKSLPGPKNGLMPRLLQCRKELELNLVLIRPMLQNEHLEHLQRSCKELEQNHELRRLVLRNEHLQFAQYCCMELEP